MHRRRSRDRYSQHSAQFLPTKLSGLAAWYRSDLGITLNGGAVAAWGDQSGNGRHLSQGTAANQPTYVSSVAGLGNRPALSFDAGGDILQTSTPFALPREHTIFYVLGAVTFRGCVVEHMDLPSTFGFYVFAPGNAAWSTNGNARYTVQSPLTNFAQPNQSNVIVYDRVTASHPLGYAESSDIAWSSTVGSHPAASNITAHLTIGQRLNGGTPHGGQIAEVGIYNRALDSSEVAALRDYLARIYP
jgi:hypothetical protein